LKFCPKCGSFMIMKGGKFVCRKCGYEEESEKREFVIESKRSGNDIPVIEEKVETLPKTKVVCPYCGNTEAYWWIRQMRAADEPETRFYRCTKCGKTWREYA